MPRSHRRIESSTDPIARSLPTVVDSEQTATDREFTVLHVDDEPDFASMTKAFLERIDDRLTVRTETSAVDALDTVAEAPIDGIVSDYQMPRMDGLEFLQAVREEHPALPFILCTARGSEEIASDAIAAGVTDYIQKKTDTDQYEVLANRLTNAIDQHKTRQRLWETLSWSSQLLNQSLTGVYIVQDGQFVFVNEHFASLFEYEPADLIGEAPSELSTEGETTCLEAVPPDTSTARYHGLGHSRTGRRIAYNVEVSTIDYYGQQAALGVVTHTNTDGTRAGDP